MGKKREGFTIIELLVVIIIIGLIATVAAPRIFKNLGKARRDIAKSKMVIIESAIGEFNFACGRYPADLEELLTPPDDLEEKWNGPYIKRSRLVDPWGNPYEYVEEGVINPGSFDLISFGADKAEGGEGEDKDIYND